MHQISPKKWIKSPQNLRLSVPYIKATLLNSILNGRAEYSLQTERGPIKVQLPAKECYEVSDEGQYADMCDMNVLNQPQVLNNILRRYKKDEIFTSIGPTLVVVNPYRIIDKLFNNQLFESIQQKVLTSKLNKEQPHVYFVAGRAYQTLKQTSIKQAIVISGESGAGKTESTKYCMQMLTSLSLRKNNSIEGKILSCNPVLQAFGNSKTVRNQNSSRFGKYVKIYFNSDHLIKGANIHSYLLQKSRVVSISQNERTFHSFYALVASNKYNTKKMEDYYLLRQSNCYHSSHINDGQSFIEINKAFSQIGFSEPDINKIWLLLKCILMLGNISFDDSTRILDESKPCNIIGNTQFQQISSILNIDKTHLQKILIFERKKFLKEYTLSPYNKQNCISNLQTLCKAIYNSIFEYIIHKIKLSLAPNTTQTELREINILDIFGFENFELNSFEQFCINFTNEKLLKLYNNYIFDRQMQILKQDGLQKQILGILPPSNGQIINLISGKISLFSITNDMTLPQFTDEDIIRGFKKIIHPSLVFDKIDKYKFKIIHSQAAVDYNINNFKIKNQDKINQQMMDIVNQLFSNIMKEQTGKTILIKFNRQIDDLMNQLNTSSVHFIRCIKPNQSKIPFSPNQNYILTQIRYLGIFQTIMIRKNTFPFRKIYRDFRKQFIIMFPQLKKQKNQKIATKMMLQSLTKDNQTYLLGNQRVYVSSELQQILNQQVHKYLALRLQKIKILQRGLRRCIFRKNIIRNLYILSSRIKLWKKIILKLNHKIKRIGFSKIIQYSQMMKKKRQQEQKEQITARKLQKKKLKDQKNSAASKFQIILTSISSKVTQQFFYMIKKYKSKKNKLNISLQLQEPVSQTFNNSTKEVGDSVIGAGFSPYRKPETPSSQLIGKSQSFVNPSDFESYRSGLYTPRSGKSVIFEGNIQIQPFSNHPNPNLPRLRSILSEQYKVQIQGNQQDFFSPPSSHTLFRLEQLSIQTTNQILNFPLESYFNSILRKRTTFLGSKKTYQQILVSKKNVLSKSMTILNNQKDQKRALKLFNWILKIGDQIKIQNVLKYVQSFIQDCQSSSLELKNQIFVQLIRQTNTNQELTAIRTYQTMAVFLHVYNPSQDLLKATLSLFYYKMQGKKLGVSQNEYLRYIFSILYRKIKKKSSIGYLPISYQIMGLMCKRQISIPVYLPTGNSILIKVESYNTFTQIKSRCMSGFGINALRYPQQLFTFYQVVNFDNQELDESPIRETNMVWDMMTYWQLTKTKYIQTEIKPPNFFLMFKMRYIVQCAANDQQTIQLYFSQLYFDYFMGRIMRTDEQMYLLAAIIKLIKYEKKTTAQIFLGILPLWFSKKQKKEAACKRIDEHVDLLLSTKMQIIDMKYKFGEICQHSELSLATIVPTEPQNEDFQLYFKSKFIILVHNPKNIEIIALKKLIKWSFDKEYFYFQVTSEKEQKNKSYKIRTDFSSLCNQYLKNIPQNKFKNNLPPSQGNFFKK